MLGFGYHGKSPNKEITTLGTENRANRSNIKTVIADVNLFKWLSRQVRRKEPNE